MIKLPTPYAAAQIAAFLDDHLSWSVWWDKQYGLWRVAEDDTGSDLYAENRDVDDMEIAAESPLSCRQEPAARQFAEPDLTVRCGPLAILLADCSIATPGGGISARPLGPHHRGVRP
jgi:hypothetical protein